jgi:hypothetical protein
LPVKLNKHDLGRITSKLDLDIAADYNFEFFQHTARICLKMPPTIDFGAVVD